jgi:hypothetical protein
MYKRQRGLLPFILRLGGLVAILQSMITLIVWVPRALFHQNVPANYDPIIVIITDFPIYLVMGLLLLSVFPEIRLTPDGLKYRVVAIYGLIKWSEIESVEQIKYEMIRIAIKRDGLSYFNGLFFQRIIGWYMRHEYPVLLLSPGLEGRDEIVQEILLHSIVRKVRVASDAYT